jgi:putative membrane protein
MRINTSAGTAARLLNYVPPHREARVRSRPQYGKALLAGMAAGLAGAWAMSEYAALSSGWFHHDGGAVRHGRKPLGSREEMDATLALAKKMARALNVRLRCHQEYAAAKLVHYAVGAGLGAAYAVVAERLPKATRGLGMAFTTTEWAASELAMPALKITKPGYSWRVRMHALTGHMVLGAAMEAVRRVLLRPASRTRRAA